MAYTIHFFLQQISMNVLGAMNVMIMQPAMIVMVVTCVSVCQDSREMATVVQVNCNILYPPLSTTTLA